MNRGEIWLVNFAPTIGSEIKKTRPALILSIQPFAASAARLWSCLSQAPTVERSSVAHRHPQ
jgi:mRNA-degrading endonuclease toxin of MazEF toxin-antitoxin module